MKRFLFLLLCFPAVASGQFRMVSSNVTLDSTVNDSTYIISVDFFSDQTAKGYFASGITADYRVFSQTGQLYDITAASNLTLSSGELTIVEIDNNYVNTELAPTGQILVFDPQGDYITYTPFGNSNMGQVLQQAIGTYNAVVSSNTSGTGIAAWDSTETYEQFQQVSQAGKIYTNRTGSNTSTVPGDDIVNWEVTNKTEILNDIDGRDTISQASHPFSVGDPLWYSGDYILAQDTGSSVRVDGIVVEVIDANTFVRQRGGKFTLSSHGFTDNIQLYVQSDGSYGTTPGDNTLPYGFAVDGNTIEIGLKPDAVRTTVEHRTFEFSRKTIESITRAKDNKKTWVISDTVTISGNLDVSDLDIIFEKNGFISGADTITANGASISANSNKQLWNSTTVIEGNWDVKNSYMEWTIGEVTSDSVANYQALKNAVQIQTEGVILQAKSYRTAGKNSSDTRVTDSDIIIKGVDRRSSKIVLLTKHTYNSTQDNGYFRNDEGNNVLLENFTLTTKDFENGIETSINNPYVFITARYTTNTPNTKPNVDFIVFDRLNMHGVALAAGVGISSVNQVPADYVNNSIRKVDIKNCFFEANHSVFVLSGMYVDNFNFTYNVIRNCRSQTIGRSSSGVTGAMLDSVELMQVYIANNDWKNDSIIDGRPFSYLCPFVFQGGDAVIENNKVEGFIARSLNTEVYPWYYSGNRVTVRNNTFKNIFGKQSDYGVYGFDLKNNLNQKVEGNKFLLEKQVFVDLGLIDSLSQDLSTLKDTLNYSLMKINVVDNAVRQRDLTFKNNEINVPYVNGHTDAHSLKRFDFSGNNIKIGYFGDQRPGGYTGTDLPGAIFWNRSTSEVNEDNKDNWISKGNTWTIGECELPILYYNKGTAFSALTDSIVNFGTNLIEDTWNVDNTTVYYTIMDSEKFTCNSVINGENSSIGFDRIGNSVTRRPPAATTLSNILVNDFDMADTLGFAVDFTNSSFTIEAKKNSSDTIRLFEHTRNDALYQNRDSLPLKYTLTLVGEDIYQQPIKKSFEWYLGFFRDYRYKDVDGNLDAVDGDSGASYLLDTLYDKYQTDQNIFLLLEQIPQGSGVLKSYFRLGGTDILESFKVNLSISRSDAANTAAIDASLGTQFQAGIYGTVGKSLTLESTTNPYGGSNEIGQVVSDISGAIDSLKWQMYTVTTASTVTLNYPNNIISSTLNNGTFILDPSGFTGDNMIVKVNSFATDDVTLDASGSYNFTINGVTQSTYDLLGDGAYADFSFNSSLGTFELLNSSNDHLDKISPITTTSTHVVKLNDFISIDSDQVASETTVALDATGLPVGAKFTVNVRDAETYNCIINANGNNLDFNGKQLSGDTIRFVGSSSFTLDCRHFGSGYIGCYNKTDYATNTGYEFLRDTTYTIGSGADSLEIPAGDTVTFQLQDWLYIDSELPLDNGPFIIDSTIIADELHADYDIRINTLVRTATPSTYLEVLVVAPSISGGDQIIARTQTFPKGTNTWVKQNLSIALFGGSIVNEPMKIRVTSPSTIFIAAPDLYFRKVKSAHGIRTTYAP